MKLSFLRKKWWRLLGRACLPKKQRKVVFVSAKALLFTQTGRSWSWGSSQAGCLDWRWSFHREPAHHAHKETSTRAAEGLRHLNCTQTCRQHPGAKFTPTKAGRDRNQAGQPVLLARLGDAWGTALVSLAAGLLLSSTHSFLLHLSTTERGKRGWTHHPPQLPHTPPQPRGKSSG